MKERLSFQLKSQIENFVNKLVFFYPKIEDDGLKKTLITYLKFFSEKYDVILITGSMNFKISKKLVNKIKIDYIKNSVINRIKLINNLFCFFKMFKYFNKKNIFFSLDKHLYPLIVKFFNQNFNLVLRIPNPIMTKKVSKNYFFSNYAGNYIGKFDLNFLKFADKVIVYSKQNFDFIRKEYQFKNLILIRNFFEKKKEVNDKKIKKIYNIFFIGRLENNKDPFFFLSSLIKIKNLNLNLHIVGDGSEKKRLLKLKTSHYKKNIRIHGHVNDPFKKFYKNIDLFCLTSKYDGTPNVLGEAISYKIPCVAPRSVGSVNELLGNGKFGNIYKPEDEKNFTNVVIKALKNYKRSVLKAKLAYDNLEIYNKENTLEKLNQTLISLLR